MATIDPSDALGIDITVQTRLDSVPAFTQSSTSAAGEGILRIVPRNGGLYSEPWITDRARFAVEALSHGRLRTPRSIPAGGGVLAQTA